MLGTSVIDVSKGPISRCIAGESGLLAYQVVIVISGGRLVAANAENPSHAGHVVGMTRRAFAEGETAEFVQSGTIQNGAWHLSPGMAYYLSAGGELTLTPPDTGFVQRMGIAKSETEFILNIGEPISR